MDKKSWFLLFVLVILALVFIIIVSRQGEKKNQGASYVIFNNFIYAKFHNDNWTKLDRDQMNEINWKKFDIYGDDGKINTYSYVVNNDKFYYFDDNSDSYRIDEEVILFSQNSAVSFSDFDKVEFNNKDYENVDKFLKKHNHSAKDLTIYSKYQISKNSCLYIVSNAVIDSEEQNSNDVYYVVIYRLNGKDYLLVDENYLDDYITYDLKWVLQENGSKYYNLVLRYNCDEDICYDMFRYNINHKNYERVISSYDNG